MRVRVRVRAGAGVCVGGARDCVPAGGCVGGGDCVEVGVPETVVRQSSAAASARTRGRSDGRMSER